MIIKESVKIEIKEIIEKFNREKFASKDVFYFPKFKKNYLYLFINRYGDIDPMCRLKYNGKMTNWDFEIFKYSSETYTDDIFLMPGAEEVDGTIKGAMLAGLELYPV